MTLQEYNDFYKLPLLKNITIEILGTGSPPRKYTNANIVSEQMTISRSLCSEPNLRYGRCESACLKIRIANGLENITGLNVKVYMEAATDSNGYLLAQNGDYLLTEDGKKIKLSDDEIESLTVCLGTYKVYSEKPTNDRMWRDLVCYDWMYDLLHLDASAWYNNLIFPLTLQDLRYSFFATFFAGMDVTTPLINDSLVIQKGFIVDGSLSGKTVMEAILEMNGVFGYINPENNKFDYISLPDAEELTLDYYQDGTGSYENYVTDAITGIRAIGSNNDAGTTVGTTSNLYMIENNPIIYGIEGTQALEDALDNLLSQIENDSFRPFKVTTYGNPMLPLGTKVTINTRNETVTAYVISKEMTGIQSLKDTYEAKSEKSQPTNSNSVANDIKRTKGQIVLKVDANGKIVQAMLSADADTGSEFKVQADNISFIANDTIDLESANLSIKADNFYINPDGSFGSSDGTNPTFSVAANGNVYVKGNINATYGSIGGLTISIGGIYYKDSTKYSGFSSGIWVLGAGATSTDYSGAPFRVNTGGITVIDTLYIKGTSGTPNLYEPLHMSDVGGYAQLAFGNISSSEYTIIMTGNDGGASFKGDLTVRGAKNRVVKTNEYGDRLLYCYETPTPMFGDIGEGKIAEDGKCYVWLDSTFSETIKTESYQVFLQKYGQGECYVTERTSRYFVVEGDIGMVFGWEIKARQAGFENLRLENYYEPNTEDVSINYGSEANEYLKMIKTEREVA